MSDILDKICRDKRAQVSEQARRKSFSDIDHEARAAPLPRGFASALHAKIDKGAIGLIAEIKSALLAALERDRQSNLVDYIGADAASVTAEPWPASSGSVPARW